MKRLLPLLLTALVGCNNAQTVTITVDTAQKIAEIQPNMYGIFFEDINFGADGGLYGELVKNRSFDFPHPQTGWTMFGDVKIASASPAFPRNPNYATLTLAPGSLTGTGMDNAGFKGIGLKEGETYNLSFWAKGAGTLKMDFVDADNDLCGGKEIQTDGGEWKQYRMEMTPERTDAHGRLRINLLSEGTLCLDHISLFPAKTWKGRENGMREALASALNDLNPGVFRFPGGCIVEGTTLGTRYQWKNSVGQVENRPLNINRWNYTFRHKFFPDYFQSYGLGFYEYFLLCEDFGADALPVLSCGIACQFENDQCVEPAHLQPYIDDALDLIEFANGATGTKWGGLRAQMGHPEPFGLKMIGIGNEQWGEVYPPRLEMFVRAIRAKYPEILIVGSSGPSADGEQFEYLWPEMRRIGVDLVDEHYYKSPEWFLANAGRYDNYDRNGPKVFAGEYASHHAESGKANNFLSALSEAAFMTGLERNADVVHLATYAPLFAHVDAWQWRPDLIWFDNMQRLLTPNYYVQQLYGHHAGTHALKTSCGTSDLKGEEGIYASSAVDENKSVVIIKIANVSDKTRNFGIELAGEGKKYVSAEVVVLQHDDLMAVNTFENPLNVAPQEGKVTLKGNKATIEALNNSFNVLIVKYE